MTASEILDVIKGYFGQLDISELDDEDLVTLGRIGRSMSYLSSGEFIKRNPGIKSETP